MQITTDETISIDPNLFTMIIQFDVDEASGEAFIRDLTEAVSRSVVQLPGFRSAAFQLSSDRTRVVNYAQWDTSEIYHRSMATLDPENGPVPQAIARHHAQVAHTRSTRSGNLA